MSGRVIFSLTDRQAAHLRELRAGRQPKFPDDRHGTREQGTLFDRGFVRGIGRGLELTDLGRAAADLADKLAKR